MKKLCLITIFLFCGVGGVSGQAAAGAAMGPSCPVDKVCISREAALKAVADADKVKALEAEIAVKDQAFADQKDLLNKMRIEFAEKAGENTALKQNAVSDRAIIEILLKSVRPKKIGLINLF